MAISAGNHFEGIWGLIFSYVSLFLESYSMFSLKIFYRCFLYYSDGHYNKRVLLQGAIFKVFSNEEQKKPENCSFSPPGKISPVDFAHQKLILPTK